MPKIYVDSNVLIIGRMIKESNSRLILEAAEMKTISLTISEDTLQEVVEFFKRNLGKTEAALARYYVLMVLNAEITWRNEYEEQIEKCRRGISDPSDAPHIAAALKSKSNFILSTNRHFLKGLNRIKVLTPKEMAVKLGMRPYENYY